MPQPSVVPPLLNSSATAANRFFERRSSRTTRTCGSPNTPRTLAAARKPGSEYPSDSRRRRCFDLAILQHAKIERIPNLKKALIHKLICRYNPLKSSTRLPEDPLMKWSGEDDLSGRLLTSLAGSRSTQFFSVDCGLPRLARRSLPIWPAAATRGRSPEIRLLTSSNG